MKTSTKTTLAGVVLLLVPIPPFATLAGLALASVGVGMKLFGSD